MASLTGLVSVILAKIGYFTRGFVMTIFAILEEVGVAFVIECYIPVIGREYHCVGGLGNRGAHHGGNQQGNDPFHDEVPFGGYHEVLP